MKVLLVLIYSRKSHLIRKKIYVELSQIRSIEKMFFVGNYNRAAIKVNLMVEKEYAFL